MTCWMKQKPARVNFFRLKPGKKGGVEEFKKNLEATFSDVEKNNWKNVPTLELDDDKYYISSMQQRMLDENYNGEELYYWLITISRVDFDQEIILADVTKTIDERRREVEHSDDEGLVVDTRIIFDPFRNILAIYAQRGTINTNDLRKFICALVDRRGIQFEIILNSDGYLRINKLDIVQQISYKVASPDNFKSYANESRAEFADFKFAKNAKGEELTVIVKSNQLEKKNVLKKAQDMLSTPDEVEVKSLTVDGISDGVFDSIDLIKNKLVYKGNIEFNREIDNRAAYGLLNKAYDKYYSYLKSQFKILQVKERIDGDEERKAKKE